MPAALAAGWFRLYRPDASDVPLSDHLERALARVNEAGKPRRVRQIRFCPHGPWFTVADDADLDGVEGTVACCRSVARDTSSTCRLRDLRRAGLSQVRLVPRLPSADLRDVQHDMPVTLFPGDHFPHPHNAGLA